MSIIIDENTKVLVQGITGNEGAFHTRQMIDYGTKIVAGVTPGKGGTSFEGIPVYNSVYDAIREHSIDATAIFVPPAFAADAIIEAAESGIKTIVCLTEGIPTLDMITAYHYLKSKAVWLIGPNTPGIISPGKCKIGVMAGYIHKKGSVGIISRSGTLTYEVVYQLSKIGLGQSTCIGIGGDPIVGLKYMDLLGMFEYDTETDVVVMIGEIGGSAEEDAVLYYREKMKKPLVAFIAGVTAPEGRRMGHAGAIISGGKGDAKTKIKVLKEAGVFVVQNPAEIGQAVLDAKQGRV
ncbi:MAG TPA: succinate--CoA ligase subunit alpha [Syntrophorhabdaceae bacterium]|nr:succinate--CoA ligase subunit alpha [Syntrophorhabdaceae bacterium]